MNDDDLTEKTADFFRRNFPMAFKYNYNKKELIIRCPFCGDSVNKRNSHLYINAETKLFYCVRCNEKGILDIDHLMRICDKSNVTKNLTDIDYEIIKEINKDVKKRSKNRQKKIYNDADINKIFYNISLDHVPNLNTKLFYLNDRLGLKYTANEYKKLKVIFSIKGLLSKNDITKYTVSEEKIDELDKYFIGFLSLNNGYITMRNIDDMYGVLKDYRYINYNIFNSNNKSSSMRNYCIPSKINVMSTNPIHIHIAEGCFDILSIYLRSELKENSIFIASNGKGYKETARLILVKYGIINPILDIYPDNDVSDYFIRKEMKIFKGLNIPIYYHRNKFPKEKDFGVPSNRIDEVVYK